MSLPLNKVLPVICHSVLEGVSNVNIECKFSPDEGLEAVITAS